MYVRATVVLGLLMGVTGCSANKMSSSSGVNSDYGAYEESAAYGGDYDYAEDEMDYDDSPSLMSKSTSEDRSFARRSRRAKRAERSGGAMGGASPSGSAAPEPAPTATDGSAEPEPAVADDETKDHGRHIIYTASMALAVFNLEDAMARAESLPEKYGGYVQNMSENYFVIRIPADKLRPAMEELSGLGTVQGRTLDAQDVTEEYLDIETRIEVLEATQKQMMELLTKARTVEEALKVRQALDQTTMELEVLKGRLRRLASLVSFSTLTLSLIERGPHNATPSSNDPFRWVDDLGVEATEWK